MTLIKLSDYLAQWLVDRGVQHVLMLTGGGAMHLNDSLGKQPGLEYICTHHEQAAAIAAEGYARLSGRPGVVCVTTGPGGTNAITGVLGQWLDSIPALYLSGQVRYATTIHSTPLLLRQLGDQEADIVSIVRPITKYAVLVQDPLTIRYHLEKAWHLATQGRPGPVWLDLPLDVQGALIDPDTLPGYDAGDEAPLFDVARLPELIQQVLSALQRAERPVLFGGAGVRLAGAVSAFRQLAERLNIPVQVAWDAIDLFPSDHPLYAGRPSTVGQRAANLIFQNCDLLLTIGCRMNLRQIGYTFPAVARAAFKISVDIDAAELQKPTFRPDLPIHADAAAFLQALLQQLPAEPHTERPAWLNWCRQRQMRYPVVLPQQRSSHAPINPYAFCEALGQALDGDEIIVSSNGASCVIPIQTLPIHSGQRHIVNSGCAGMGYGLPAAIGACLANRRERVICLEGDGSIQLNLQEFATLVYHQLPVKIFLFENGGYLSIRSTQDNFFAGHRVGESPQSGVGLPDLSRVAQAYGIPAFDLREPVEMRTLIRQTLATPGPVLCNVHMDPAQTFSPRISSRRLPDGRMVSSPLEDMFPFLERDELLSNLLIPPWQPD